MTTETRPAASAPPAAAGTTDALLGAAVLEALPDAVLIADDERRYVAVNDAACRLLGRSRDEILAMRIDDLAPPEARPWVAAAWDEFLRAGSQESSMAITRPDGSVRHVDYTARAGILPGTHLSVLRDVTPRVETERDLRERLELVLAAQVHEGEVRFQAALDAIPDPMSALVAIREDGEVVDFEVRVVNRAWREWYVPSRQDPIGQRLYDLLPEFRARLSLHLAAMATGRPQRREVEVRGRVFEILSTRFGDGVMVASRDVTARVEAQRALEEGEERYRTLLDELHAVVLVIDEETGGWFVSERARQLLGFAPDQLAAPGFWFTRVEPEDQALVLEAWEGGRLLDAYDFQYRFRRADDQVVWLEARMRAVAVRGRVTRRWYAIVEDVTERRRAEEQLVRSDRLQALARVTAAAAHDFGNVLLGIRMFQGYLLASVPPDDPRHPDVVQIGTALERGQALTQQLLDFARERAPGPAEPVDLGVVLRDLLPMLGRLAGERVTVVLDAEDGIAARMTRGGLEQAVMNLVLNARDAMPEGGTLRLAVRRETVRAGVTPDLPAGRYAVLAVTDTGTGMTPEVEARALEPYFTTKVTGTGIGLSSVYGTVREAGGAVRLETAAGAGTTVVLLLPEAAGGRGPRRGGG